MHIPFYFARDNTECPSGTQYYTCAKSNYKGCCTVDACDFDNGCPDNSSPDEAGYNCNADEILKLFSLLNAYTICHPLLLLFLLAFVLVIYTPPFFFFAHTILNCDQSSSHHLSGGAIGGIVTAGVIAFIVLFCLVLWRMRRRNQQLKEMAEAAQAAAAGQQHPPTNGSVFPQLTPSPANPLGTPGIDEKFSSANVSQREILMINDANGVVNAKVAELQGNSPASTTIPLFGEATTGSQEEAIARWGLHGARMMALHNAGLRRAAGAEGVEPVVDYGGNYQVPVSELEPGIAPAPLHVGPNVHVAELDGQRPAVVSELETPQPTPMSTPGIGSYSPSLSVDSSHVGGRSTMVSPWRNSSRTLNSEVNTITEEGGSESGAAAGGAAYLQPSPIPSPSLQPPHSPSRSVSTTEPPRATLDLSQTERSRGVNVTSWGSYKP
ncbi:hypothetical protein SPBR_02753 [Sporothrix brasiliensis 5110]|uniref:Uncharacterized protein n=1 Tax=Sporothrix brasiliensis 5110 TaxID=1398154 RepID=A0A0C2J6U1_9PEZI|nr:uncharacterized protein SPBR_02753 [Sporothrix brasiliensis 5110]KIH92742.1 hypothetical protein SPBR_02753 [Sporothrix brasiliensis 5110]